jgi:hypothetical protein
MRSRDNARIVRASTRLIFDAGGLVKVSYIARRSAMPCRVKAEHLVPREGAGGGGQARGWRDEGKLKERSHGVVRSGWLAGTH